MSRYFDKDFFRFLFGFVAIILVSMLVLFFANRYEADRQSPGPDINVAQPQS